MPDPVPTGRYKIVNVRSSNTAYLLDPNDGTPVNASSSTDDNKEFWNVTILSNGKYTFQNFGTTTYANVGPRAPAGSVVEGRSRAQHWTVLESRTKGQYIIATTDTRCLWSFADGEHGTELSLAEVVTDSRNQWRFEKA